jgi:hypothetical protein
LEGRAAVQSIGVLDNGQLALNLTTMDTRKFVYRQDKQTIKEDRLSLASKGKIDFNTRSLFLAPIDSESF